MIVKFELSCEIKNMAANIVLDCWNIISKYVPYVERPNLRLVVRDIFPSYSPLYNYRNKISNSSTLSQENVEEIKSLATDCAYYGFNLSRMAPPTNKKNTRHIVYNVHSNKFPFYSHFTNKQIIEFDNPYLACHDIMESKEDKEKFNTCLKITRKCPVAIIKYINIYTKQRQITNLKDTFVPEYLDNDVYFDKFLKHAFNTYLKTSLKRKVKIKSLFTTYMSDIYRSTYKQKTYIRLAYLFGHDERYLTTMTHTTKKLYYSLLYILDGDVSNYVDNGYISARIYDFDDKEDEQKSLDLLATFHR